MNVSDLLYAAENGIIDLARLQDTINMSKESEYLNNHPYAIWEGKNKKWYTYLPDKEKGRKLIKKSSEEDVRKAIIAYYKGEASTSCITFRYVYNEWRKYQDKTVGDNTITKYESDERRYFREDPFLDRPIHSYTEDDIKVWIIGKIDDLKLCKDACKTLISYCRNTFDFARRKKYISENPMEYLSAKMFGKYCCESKRSLKEPVIAKEDMAKLEALFEEDYQKRPGYIPTYAVELASLTGMRVGEISALRWDTVHRDHIRIDKSEKFNRKTHEYYISKTKNNKIRSFPLTPEIRELLSKVKEAESKKGWLCEWVFANENGRIHASEISSCLRSKCHSLGITERGIHAYRKTLNSVMRSNGISSVVAASLIGNSVQVNDKYYTFDVASIEEKCRIIQSATSKMKTVYAPTHAPEVIRGNQAEAIWQLYNSL